MTPNDVLRYAHDPTGHASIAAVDKLPTAPLLLSGGRTRFIGIVIWTAAEWFFMTIVPLAGKKGAAHARCAEDWLRTPGSHSCLDPPAESLLPGGQP